LKGKGEKINKMKQEEKLKIELLPKIIEAMCEFVTYADYYYPMKTYNKKWFFPESTKPFTPSAGDKMIFRQIANQILDQEDIQVNDTIGPRTLAFKALQFYYFPFYL
jgi:hypothetical protein